MFVFRSASSSGGKSGSSRPSASSPAEKGRGGTCDGGKRPAPAPAKGAITGPKAPKTTAPALTAVEVAKLQQEASKFDGKDADEILEKHGLPEMKKELGIVGC